MLRAAALGLTTARLSSFWDSGDPLQARGHATGNRAEGDSQPHRPGVFVKLSLAGNRQ